MILDNNNFDGVEIITEGVNPSHILSFAIGNGDRRLIGISGDLCVENSKILGDQF